MVYNHISHNVACEPQNHVLLGLCNAIRYTLCWCFSSYTTYTHWSFIKFVCLVLQCDVMGSWKKRRSLRHPRPLSSVRSVHVQHAVSELTAQLSSEFVHILHQCSIGAVWVILLKTRISHLSTCIPWLAVYSHLRSLSQFRLSCCYYKQIYRLGDV